jgi:hypothetical protein
MGEYLSVGELKAARRGEQNHDDRERDGKNETKYFGACCVHKIVDSTF